MLPQTGVQRSAITGLMETMPCKSLTLPMRPSSVSVSPTTNRSSLTGWFAASTVSVTAGVTFAVAIDKRFQRVQELRGAIDAGLNHDGPEADERPIGPEADDQLIGPEGLSG